MAFWAPESIAKTSSTLKASWSKREETRTAEFSSSMVDADPEGMDLFASVDCSSANSDLLEDMPPMMESLDCDGEEFNCSVSSVLSTAMISQNLADESHTDVQQLSLSRSSLGGLDSPCGGENEIPLMYSAYGADVWAAGVSVHCFLFGALPFSIKDGSGPVEIMNIIAEYEAPTSFHVHDIVARQEGVCYSTSTKSANELWSKLLITDPSCRLSLTQSFETEWLSAESFRRENVS